MTQVSKTHILTHLDSHHPNLRPPLKPSSSSPPRLHGNPRFNPYSRRRVPSHPSSTCSLSHSPPLRHYTFMIRHSDEQCLDTIGLLANTHSTHYFVPPATMAPRSP
ncbi:hypothetical protein V6N13_061965 [Hibiscus sabdariffa]|uniref:Uncharacterized protein n=1 Tax=Hibiscus sabdariffa TaxID=183260 RepID=A0ABR2AH39_9ROSI